MKEGAERGRINELGVRDSGRKKEQEALVGDGVGSRGVSLVKPVVVLARGVRRRGGGSVEWGGGGNKDYCLSSGAATQDIFFG